MIAKEKTAWGFLLVVLAVSVASSLVGADMNSGLPSVEVEDIANGPADDVIGWDGSGVAISQSREGARVFHDATQSISHNVVTKLSFNDEDYDDNTMHDTSTNNPRITIKTAGRYIVLATIAFSTNSVGERHVMFRLNGSTNIVIETHLPVPINQAIFSVSIIRNFIANDYIEIFVYQNSTVALNILSDSTSPFFAVQRVRDE